MFDIKKNPKNKKKTHRILFYLLFKLFFIAYQFWHPVTSLSINAFILMLFWLTLQNQVKKHCLTLNTLHSHKQHFFGFLAIFAQRPVHSQFSILC